MKKFNFFLIATAFLGTSCVHKQLILSAPVVSMTQTSKPESKFTEVGPVDVKFCLGEDAISTKSNNVGVLDEVITRAQRERKADFIKDAQLFSENKAFSNSCYILTGIAVK